MEVLPQGPIKAEGFKSLARPIEQSGVPPFGVTYVAPTLVRYGCQDSILVAVRSAGGECFEYRLIVVSSCITKLQC